MGVKTSITLREANELFSSYDFTKLIPTTSGIMDTTYIVFSQTDGFILKKYERDISQKVEADIQLLDELKVLGLNTPKCIDKSKGWYLYEKLHGTQPRNIQTYHIQALARFLSKLHSFTGKRSCQCDLIDKNELGKLLKYTKENFYIYYKKLNSLKKYDLKHDGIIHGDIFKDNTVFDGKKIGVFDFVDSGCGSFAFDSAVALLGFDTFKHNQYNINLFLNTYNQNTLKKLSKKEILSSIEIASKFYALKRINKSKKTSSAKELIRYI